MLVFVILSSVLATAVSAEQTNMEVFVPRLASMPVFDGVINASEWGEKTLRMVTEGAATVNSTKVAYSEELGLKNYFYYSFVENACDTLAYDLWLRWDEEYLYVAAIVDDPDPFALHYGGKEIWRGDCFQIRVDEKGPSSISLKSNPDFNYKTDAFDGKRFSSPWYNAKETFNTIMGLVKGSDPTLWRCGPNYDDGWKLTEDGGLIGIDLVQHENDTCTITYECAIPWTSVNKDLMPKANDVFGIGIAAYCSDSNEVNAMLQWGCGVGFVHEQPRGTRGGSQAMILTDNVAGGTYPTDSAPGDTNGNGKINLADVSLMLKHIAKWNVPINAEAADVTDDSKVNLADAALLLKYIAKWNVTLK